MKERGAGGLNGRENKKGGGGGARFGAWVGREEGGEMGGKWGEVESVGRQGGGGVM